MRLLVVCQLSGDVTGYEEALLDLNFKIGRFALWGGSLDFQKSPSSDLMARDERRRPLATSSLGRPLAKRSTCSKSRGSHAPVSILQ